MKILLFGATGRVGHDILRKTLADEHRVTALIRSPEKVTTTSDFLTAQKGNVLHQDDIMQTMADADVVISALNTNKNGTLSKSMPLIIKAMKHHGLSRIITIGTAGILDSRHQPELYRFQSAESKRRTTTAAEDHLGAYKYLAASQLDWTVVCPTYLPEGEAIGQCRSENNLLPEGGKKISVGDTATFAYHQLFLTNSIRARVGIAY